jgi:CyaY protein
VTAIPVAEFDRRAEATLVALRAGLDAIDSEAVDSELGGGILTIEFSDGARYVVNSHRAALQIWLAADAQAWHFDWHPERAAWVAPKGGEELFATLDSLLSARLGSSVTLAR